MRRLGLMALCLVSACCPSIERVPDPSPSVRRGALVRLAPHSPSRTSPHSEAIEERVQGVRAEPRLLPRESLLLPTEPSLMTLAPDGSAVAWVATDGGERTIRMGQANQTSSVTSVRTLADHESVTALAWTYETPPRLLTDIADGTGRQRLWLTAGGSSIELTVPSAGVIERWWVGAGARADILLAVVGADGARSLVRQRLDLGAPDVTVPVALPPGSTAIPGPDLAIPFAFGRQPDGRIVIWRRGPPATPFERLTTVAAVDAGPFRPLWAASDASHLIALDRTGRSRVALVRIDGGDGARTLLAEDRVADVDAAVLDPKSGAALSVTASRPARTWQPLSDEARLVGKAFTGSSGSHPEGLSRAMDGSRWLLVVRYASAPTRYHVWSARPGTGGIAISVNTGPPVTSTLASPFAEFKEYPLSRTRDIELTASDGLALRGRVTLPASEGTVSRPVTPRPTVVLFGEQPTRQGPGSWSPRHEWLADRGYAVVEVDLRGTRGYSRVIEQAGRAQWGSHIHADIPVVVDWAIREGIADASRICALGFGWAGGYSALTSLTRAVDGRFICAAAFAPGSDLAALGPRLPADDLRRLQRLAGPDLGARSVRATDISPTPTPTLLIAGSQDAVVPARELRGLTGVLRANGADVTLAVVPGADHKLESSDNRLAVYTLLEHWLARWLDGHAQRPAGQHFLAVEIDEPDRDGDGLPDGARWLPLPSNAPPSL